MRAMQNTKAKVSNDARQLGGLYPVSWSEEAANQGLIGAIKRG